MATQSLSGHREFQAVYARGRRASSNGITVIAAPAEGPARIGLVVPGAAGKAVVRNRIKRRLRAALRSAPLPEGRHVVVRARSEAAAMPFEDLRGHLSAALTGSLEALR